MKLKRLLSGKEGWKSNKMSSERHPWLTGTVNTYYCFEGIYLFEGLEWNPDQGGGRGGVGT